MEEAAAIDSERIDLVVQLCTRIGMIMEDVSPLAMDGSFEGLHARVAAMVYATRRMAVLASAAEALADVRPLCAHLSHESRAKLAPKSAVRSVHFDQSSFCLLASSARPKLIAESSRSLGALRY
jgi:hypothetical protein